MDALEVAYRRLRNQRLSGPRFDDPVDVVRLVRCDASSGVRAGEVERRDAYDGERGHRSAAARRRRRHLRTHALRPTWHFLAAEELGWIQALTGPRVHVVNAYYNRMHGIEAELGVRTNKVIANAVRGGNHLTRNELAAALASSGIDATGNKLAYIVMYAELEGLIANGAMRGKQHTYALVSERVPNPVTRTGDDALAELTRRSLYRARPGNGQGLRLVVELDRRPDQARSRSARRRADQRGRQRDDALVRTDSPPPRDPSPTGYALQGYDEYGVAYTESRVCLNIAGLPIVPPNTNTTIQPIVLDSQGVGYWKRTVDSGRMTITPILATTLTAKQKAACDRAFQRVAAFFGVPADVLWS